MPPEPRPCVAALAGYAWEESAESVAARLGIAVSDVVRFDMNTVPWQLALDVSAAGLSLNEYPDTSYRELVDAVCGYCGQEASRIVVGAGADELISLVAQAYLDGARRFVVADPTYALFSIASLITGASAVSVPCGDRFGVDRTAFLAAAARADVVWLANPNNPTGELLPQGFVRDVASCARGLVVVDEAYAEFVAESCLDWAGDAANVVVVRTLSKAFGLAGMRVGYLVAAPELVAVVNKLRPVSSISVVSAQMGAAALGRAAEMRRLVASLVAERHRLAAALAAAGHDVVEGSANFVLARLHPAAVEAAQSRGLVLRTYGSGHRLDGWSRVTVRSPEENARLLDALRS
jgi:histidinol-phosphate aminotransferase